MNATDASIPVDQDATTESITSAAILRNSHCPNPRLKFILERLVSHLHDFARETQLNTGEWMQGIEFLTAVGKMCVNDRQEFILLSDILGLSLLVDSHTHPKPAQATPGTVLGPFHHPDPPSLPAGSTISHDQNGELCLVLCSVASSSGAPIADVEIDIWETDSSGHYDTQYPDRAEGMKGLDGRAVMKSDAAGKFWFKGIMPVEYPIPDDGPVGALLGKLGRSVYRPAHMHFWMRKGGWDDLVTALYISSSPNLATDPVFGVKAALIVDPFPATSELAAEYDVPEGTKTIKFDFVMVSEEEVRSLREGRMREKMEELRKKGVEMDDVD
ncbi:MAG: hypothetical protein Q9220_000812 [cf. Caloplaca sp. 1 TL-2023]